MKYRLFINILSILISGCKRNDAIIKNPDSQPVVRNCITSTQIPPGYPLSSLNLIDYNNSHCGYMPLGKKNFWVYLDSIYDNNGLFMETRLDTLRFIKTYQSPDSIIWWTPNTFIGFLKYNYSTDSALYTLGSRWGYGLSLKWVYSISTDSTREDCAYSDYPTECKAWKINNPVIVPAGTFQNCYWYSKIWLLAQTIDFYFKPGVGVLKFWFYYRSPTGIITPLKTSTLLSYYFE